jgi:hypothetical protein
MFSRVELTLKNVITDSPSVARSFLRFLVLNDKYGRFGLGDVLAFFVCFTTLLGQTVHPSEGLGFIVGGRAVGNQSKGKMATEDAAATSRKKQKETEVEASKQAVDVSKSENKVWLWKVTPPVYKAWQTALTKEKKDKEGCSLGSIFVTVDLLEGTKTVSVSSI